VQDGTALEEASQGGEQGDEYGLHARNGTAGDQKEWGESISTRFLVGTGVVGEYFDGRCICAFVDDRVVGNTNGWAISHGFHIDRDDSQIGIAGAVVGFVGKVSSPWISSPLV